MLKKVLAVILTVAMMFSLSTVTSYADSPSTFDISTANKTSTLNISGTTATCKSVYQDGVTVQSIKIVQTLEKHSFLWFWDTVGGEWTKTSTNTTSTSLTNTKSGLTSGTYRVVSVFTVTLSDGTTQTATIYSDEKTLA